MTPGYRKVGLIAAGTLLLVLALLVMLPYLFRDRIVGLVQTGISRSVDADVSWTGTGISLLRDFPYATLRLDDVAVAGRGSFGGDTLARVNRFALSLDLLSVLRGLRGSGPLVIRSVDIDRPVLRMIVLEDGTANWDLFGDRAADDPAEPGRLELNLRHLEIRDGAVSLDDRQSALMLAVAGLSHSLSGDFAQTQFGLSTRTAADSVSLRFAGIPYLGGARVGLEADMDVDLDAGTMSLTRTDLRLNELRLALRGSVGFGEDSLALDLALDAPGTAFQEILSLVPAVYRQDFAQLEASGTMAVSGWVRGVYGPDAFPAFNLLARVDDGQFRYPDLPLPARDVFLDLSLRNPGGDADSTLVDLRRFHVVIGDDPVEGSFSMRTPVSDPAVALQMRGRLDLADLNRTLRLPGVEELSGVLAADVRMNTRLSDIDAERYDRVEAEGFLTAADVAVRTADLPHALQVDEAALQFSPRYAELSSFRGRVGSSDLAMNGRLDNLLGFVLRDEELRGQAQVTSTFFDLDEWRSDRELEVVVVPRNLDVALVADVQRLAFGDLDLRDARGSLSIRGQRATLEDFQMKVFGGTLAVTGFYDTTVQERPTFDVGLRLADVGVAEAAGGIATLRAFAPVVQYARGRLSTELRLAGALGGDMAPLLDVLSGRGSFQTIGLALQGFPLLERLADVLHTEALRNPRLTDVRSSFSIRDGRLHVSPFDVDLGQFSTTVSGSHGHDQSMDYTLMLHVPASVLGADANRAVGALAAQAGRVGLAFQPSEVISLGVQVGGTVAQPAVSTDFRGSTTTAAQQAAAALREEANRRAEAIVTRIDATLEENRQRAEAEARRILDEAERQAERIRAEVQPLAETVRREGNEQADALLARAGNPAARVAAQVAADRLRRAADEQADRIIREADARGDALLAEARGRANALVPPPADTLSGF